jgi:hypothetical protein
VCHCNEIRVVVDKVSCCPVGVHPAAVASVDAMSGVGGVDDMRGAWGVDDMRGRWVACGDRVSVSVCVGGAAYAAVVA